MYLIIIIIFWITGKASAEKWKLVLHPSGEVLDIVDGWNSTLSYVFNEVRLIKSKHHYNMNSGKQ